MAESPVTSEDFNTASPGRNERPPSGAEGARVEDDVRALATALGFAACGITTADDLACGPVLSDWLDAGRHGDMEYLRAKHERRLRPSAALEGARSAVVVASTYAAAPPADPEWRRNLRGRVAAYALGPDYHAHVAERLEELAAAIRERTGAQTVVHVDGGPLVEKELARRAGIGWYGRNTNLLRPGLGSSFVLGVLVTTAALDPDPPFEATHCGTCRACIPACPTGALDAGPTIDARLCISYLTIEHRGPIPIELRARIGNWVFGCDVCQDVCPWNEESLQPNALQNPSLPDWITMTDAEFRERFAGTALLRPKRRGLARNAAIALGNTGNPAALPHLVRALVGHDEPLVRAHAAWAIGELGGADAKAPLELALSRETVPPVRREITVALVAVTRGAGRA
jgi:epoxyqueuosine reductase